MSTPKNTKENKSPREEAERIRIGAAPSPDKTLLATSSTKVSYDRFSRFAHRCRLAALDYYPVRDRGSQFLLKTLSDAYDAVWQANAAVTAPPPSDDPNVDVKPPEIPVVPDVVADMFWRKCGTLAPQQALEFITELEKAERAGAESALFAGFLENEMRWTPSVSSS